MRLGLKFTSIVWKSQKERWKNKTEYERGDYASSRNRLILFFWRNKLEKIEKTEEMRHDLETLSFEYLKREEGEIERKKK